MRDIGKPIVTVYVLCGMSEEIAKNRENFKMTFETALTNRNGYDTKVAINWGGGAFPHHFRPPYF
jgi:hypothetical protein